MNKPEKVEHPEWMSDDDIAIYEQMISIGRLQIGKEIGKNEEYLLHIASMITLKQMKGMVLSFDDPTVAELKRIHQENFARDSTFSTPPNEFYASVLALKEQYLSPEVEAQINEVNGLTSNLVLEDKKNTSDIADESADADITAGYVKIVARPEAIVVEATPEPP